MIPVKNRLLVMIALGGLLAGIVYATLMFWHAPVVGPVISKNEKPGWYQGKIKVGHLVALDMAPMFIAKEAGFFKENGLEVETVFFPNPGDNNVALTGNSIQFSINAFTLPHLANNSGVPMRIICSAGGLGMMQVVIQGEIGIDNGKALQDWVKANPGKKLKVGSLQGDMLEVILYKYFEQYGLKYDDFEMIWFNDLLAMVQAFETKQIDILSHIKPYSTMLIAKHGAKVLTNNDEVWGEGAPSCTVQVMSDFLEKYPETVKAYLRSVQMGFQLSVDDPERAVDLLVKGNYYKVDRDVLLYAFKNQPKKVVLQPNLDAMKAVIDDMVKLGYIKKTGSGDITRLDLLNEVEAKKK